MKKKDELLRNLFSEYGEIKEISKNDSQDNIYIYLLKSNYFNPDTISDIFIKKIKKIPFLIKLDEKEICTIYCFSIYNIKAINTKIYNIINIANIIIKYGKFFIDNDDEIDWQYNFEFKHTSKDDIKDILQNFYFVLSIIFTLIKKEIETNEEES